MSEYEPTPEELAQATHVPFVGRAAGKNGHRLLPQSSDAEMGVLSAFVTAPREVGGMCSERNLRPEHFHIPANSTTFRCLRELWDEGKPIDFITVANRLREIGRFEAVGGAPFVSSLFTYLPSAHNAAEYASTVIERHQSREIIRVCGEFQGRGYEDLEVGALLEQFEREVLAIRSQRTTKRRFTGKDIALEGLKEIHRKVELRGHISGLSTGFAALDAVTDGLHTSELIVVAAKPSLGKTAFALQISAHLAIVERHPVGIFSLEMSKAQFSERWLASRAAVNTVPWRYGLEPSQSELARLHEASGEFASAQVVVEEGSDITIQELRGSARSMVQQYGVKTLVVDSLSVLRSDSRQARENRVREVAEAIEGLKECAKELAITVIVLVHIDRKLEDHERPSLSHLRESGAIEQAADGVWMLWQPPVADGEEEDKQNPAVELWIAKNRNGERYVPVPLIFEKPFTRFKDQTTARSEQRELL